MGGHSNILYRGNEEELIKKSLSVVRSTGYVDRILKALDNARIEADG